MANEVAERIQKSEGISKEIAQVLVSRFICREYIFMEIAQHLDSRLLHRHRSLSILNHPSKK
jgi:hypothetical protein